MFTAQIGSSKIGDVAYMSTEGMIRPGITNVGLSFQNVGAGTVDVAFTYDPSHLAIKPDAAAQAGVHWSTVATAVAAGALAVPSIQAFPTAVKFTFAAAGGGIVVNSQ